MSSDTAVVTVLTASLPDREHMLTQAAASVRTQTMACEHLVGVDVDRDGPGVMRNRLLGRATTEYVGFLDDDDILYPNHVEVCLNVLAASGACVAYPWFRFRNPAGRWPLGEFLTMRKPDGTRVHAYRQPFNPGALEHNNFVPVTVVARTACLRAVGGFPEPGAPDWPHDTGEEWGLWRRLVAAGHTMVHIPEVTWEYRVHRGNTSGRRTAPIVVDPH